MAPEPGSNSGDDGRVEMKVCISSAGPFHAYDLARQMERLGTLSRLYTAYPKCKVEGLPREKVDTFPWLMMPAAVCRRLGWSRLQDTLDWLTIDTFDRWVAANLEDCQVFHHLSACAGPAQRVARERFGAVTICDRGSSHIVYQDKILSEEYAQWGLPYRPIRRFFVDRELQEYAEADRIVLPSTFAYRSFLEQGVRQDKLIKVPYGVDLNLFQRISKQDDVFRVLFVGQLSLRKGVPYLLEAVALLHLPRFEFWLIGGLSSEIKPFLNRYNDHFRWWGRTSRAELSWYYSQCSVFVLPSIEEGLALVQAQAMACGLPVIATTNTGGEDLFTNNVEGFVVPIRSPEAIREKILYLYEHPDVREKMGAAAMKRVEGMGGWASYGRQMLALYHSLSTQQPQPTV